MYRPQHIGEGLIKMIFNSFQDALINNNGLPIIIPTHNNPTYVKNSVDFYHSIGHENILLIDNNSSYLPMIDYLHSISNEVSVVMQKINFGPRQFYDDRSIYALLPEYFILTDPDLRFSNKFPTNFVDILIELHNMFNVFKIGSALNLDIKEPNVLDEQYSISGNPITIRDIENNYYQNCIGSYEGDNIWLAPIDTTFALYKKGEKENSFMDSLRIDNRFLADHFGWFNPTPMTDDEYLFYTNNLNAVSSTEYLKKYKRL